MIFKNYSNVDCKIFVIYYPCQSEQDNVIMIKSIYMLCENVTLNLK